MISSFGISIFWLVLKRWPHAAASLFGDRREWFTSTHVELLLTVAFTTVCWMLLTGVDARIQATGAVAWIAELRALMKLAAPLVVTQLAQMAIMTTDVVMLGRLGKDALAGAALGNTVFFFTWLIGLGPTAAISPMIAHITIRRTKV